MRGVIKGMLGPKESNGSLSWDGNGSFGSRDGSVTEENRDSFREEETKTNPLTMDGLPVVTRVFNVFT